MQSVAGVYANHLKKKSHISGILKTIALRDYFIRCYTHTHSRVQRYREKPIQIEMSKL